MPKKFGLMVTRIDPGQTPEAEMLIVRRYAGGLVDLVLDDLTVLELDPEAVQDLQVALGAVLMSAQAGVLPMLGEVA